MTRPLEECESHAREVTRLLAECVSEKADVLAEATVREEQRVISHAVLSRIINTRLAEIRVLRDQLAVAKRFLGSMFETLWEYGSLDGFDFQDDAVKDGILIETTYDPSLHGEQDAEPGDVWYVIAPEWRLEP